MRLGNVVACVVVAVCSVGLSTESSFQMRNQSDYVGEHCPLKLSSVMSAESRQPYSECVSVHVWMTAEDLRRKPKIEILSSDGKIWLNITKSKKKSKRITNQRKITVNCPACTNNSFTVSMSGQRKITVSCSTLTSNSSTMWELIYNCVNAEAQNIVSASFSTVSTNCSSSHTVPDPVPEFNLSVDQQSKSINVTVELDARVNVRLCYLKNPKECILGRVPLSTITIDPSQSRSAILNIPFLLPCLCVQGYYTYRDARRGIKCPFHNEFPGDVKDAWLSSVVTLYESYVTWSSKCPASYLKPSASLCWSQHTHLCTPVSNSTLEVVEDRQSLRYNVSVVDKHPQMCVQFSLGSSRDFRCFFTSDMPSWKAHIGPGRQSVVVYLTSSVPAKFSAQLCILNETGCTSRGHVHSVRMEGDTVEEQINVPVGFPAENLCVQVWQSDPAQLGKRIMCPDYTHRRCGMFAVAAVVVVVIVALVVIFIHHLTKNGAAGWLSIQKPVLLVCSSEASAHVSAVCALASILQGELCATVRMALWDQTSQRQAMAGTGVADLGPLPWLYGQWEAVSKAQGKVLIVWSPEAKKSYEKWREERAETERNEGKKEGRKAEVRHEKIRVDVEDDWKVKERRVRRCTKEKAAGKEESVSLFDKNEWNLQSEPSSVARPVFMAALARLQGALQECKGHGVAFVYFKSLGHSRDIPKDFRSVPRYGLPQDFRGLILELGGMARTESEQCRWHCWPRFLSKMLSLWLARRLAHKMRTWMLQKQAQAKKKTRAEAEVTGNDVRTQRRLELLPSAKMTCLETLQKQQPLHRSPWRGEEDEDQVSRI